MKDKSMILQSNVGFFFLLRHVRRNGNYIPDINPHVLTILYTVRPLLFVLLLVGLPSEGSTFSPSSILSIGDRPGREIRELTRHDSHASKSLRKSR